MSKLDGYNPIKSSSPIYQLTENELGELLSIAADTGLEFGRNWSTTRTSSHSIALRILESDDVQALKGK